MAQPEDGSIRGAKTCCGYRPGQAQRVLMKLRFPDFVKTAQDGGKVVSLTHRPPLPPGNAPGTDFC